MFRYFQNFLNKNNFFWIIITNRNSIRSRMSSQKSLSKISLNALKWTFADAKQFSTMKNIISKLERKLNIINEILYNMFDVYRHAQCFECVDFQKFIKNSNDDFDVFQDENVFFFKTTIKMILTIFYYK